MLFCFCIFFFFFCFFFFCFFFFCFFFFCFCVCVAWDFQSDVVVSKWNVAP